MADSGSRGVVRDPDKWWAVERRHGLIYAAWGPYSMRETAQMVADEKGGSRRGVTPERALEGRPR